MLSDPRSIAFIIECINPQMRHTPTILQKLYAKMIGDGALSYANFNLVPAGAQMTTVHGPASIPGMMANSALAIAQDRIQVKEEWPSFSLDEFVTRAKTAVTFVMNELGVPAFPLTQCIIRTLVNVQGVPDSRMYFNKHFFHMDENAATRLGRGINLFGLRLAFPATPQDSSVHNVRIESFNGDVRSLFLEDAGFYPTPFTTENLTPLETAIRGSYDFLTGNVTDYLGGLQT